MEWIRMSPKAWQSKGKARPNRYEELVNQNRISWLAELEFIFTGLAGRRRGGQRHQMASATMCRTNVEFSCRRRRIVGVIGPNGAGKRPCSMIIGENRTAADDPDSAQGMWTRRPIA